MMAINKQDWDQLITQATVRLVGVADKGLKAELYDVLTEFFNDSSCWTQTVVVYAVSTSRVYPLQVNEGQIIRLVGTYREDGSLVPTVMPNIGELLLAHAPSAAETYYSEVVTNVSLPTQRDQMPIAPDWVLPIWHGGILDGLLGRMMSQPNKSYANERTAAYHLKRFRDAIARARVSKLRANTNGTQAWRFPQSFRTNSQRGGVPATGGASERRF
jgi:hypothetical protein